MGRYTYASPVVDKIFVHIAEEVLGSHKDGEVVWLVTSGVPVPDEKGELIGYRGSDKDITARKRAEDELKEATKNYVQLFETMPNGIQLIDIEGNILSGNPARHRMVGYPYGELVGMNIGELIPENERHRALSDIQRVCEGSTCSRTLCATQYHQRRSHDYPRNRLGLQT